MNLRKLENLRECLLRSKDLPMPCLLALLTVALKPGLSVNELSETLGMPQQTASRNASILLGRYEVPSSAVKTPFILQSINDEDPKKRALELTNAGKEYLQMVTGE
jgi:DNA-binding MarR family transcriptional regulator